MTTIPYVSVRDASTTRSAAAYVASSAAPVERPGELDPVGEPVPGDPRRQPSAT